MSTPYQPADYSLAKRLEGANISYRVNFIGAHQKEGWESDKFIVSFIKGTKCESFDYHTGIGHRMERQKKHTSFSRRGPRTLTQTKKIKQLEVITKLNKPAWFPENETYDVLAPTQASVLYCLLIDLSSCDESFDDWCDNFDADTDSRKALDMYLACQSNGTKLKTIFSNDLINELQELLQDY